MLRQTTNLLAKEQTVVPVLDTAYGSCRCGIRFTPSEAGTVRLNNMSKSAKKSIKPRNREPIVIAEIDTSRPRWVYPFEKDAEGYLWDGKRVTHRQALRCLARRAYMPKLGYTIWNTKLFVEFLRECSEKMKESRA